jgi:phage terminase small subunit
MSTPRPPKGVCKEARKLWRGVLEEFHLGADSLEILRVACLSLSTYMDAKLELDETGRTFTTEGGQVKRNPLCQTERDSLTGFLQAIRLLGLDYPEQTPKPARPRGR